MEIKEVVKEKYGQAALRVSYRRRTLLRRERLRLDGCCDPITSNLYDAAQTGELPQEAVLASLGCGNPTALASSIPAKRCWILARAAASTCCSRPAASAPPAKPTASI